MVFFWLPRLIVFLAACPAAAKKGKPGASRLTIDAPRDSIPMAMAFAPNGNSLGAVAVRAFAPRAAAPRGRTDSGHGAASRFRRAKGDNVARLLSAYRRLSNSALAARWISVSSGARLTISPKISLARSGFTLANRLAR